jgi:hypothetical protein
MSTGGDLELARDGPMTAQELVTYAKTQGFTVSARQIERLHKAACLPRPQRMHVRGVRGSRSYYPIGTAAQLIAVCRLSKCERSLKRICFQLWLDGYPVPLKPLRGSLQRLLFAGLPQAVRRIGDEHIHSPLKSAEVLTALLAPRLRRTALGRLIHDHLPHRADQTSLLTMFFQLFLGDMPAFDAAEDYVNGDLDPGERDTPLPELFVQVYGLDRAQTDTMSGAPPWLPQDITPLCAR